MARPWQLVFAPFLLFASTKQSQRSVVANLFLSPMLHCGWANSLSPLLEVGCIY